MLPRPYAPIIPLGKGPCGHVKQGGSEEEEGGGKREKRVREGSEKRKVAEELF